MSDPKRDEQTKLALLAMDAMVAKYHTKKREAQVRAQLFRAARSPKQN